MEQTPLIPPSDEYRILLGKVTSSKFFRTRLALTTIITCLINLGISFLVVHGDAVGLLGPPHTQDPEKTALFLDLIITGFCVGFFTTLFNAMGITKGLETGAFEPVPLPENILWEKNIPLCWKFYRMYPVKVKIGFARALAFGVVDAIVFPAISIVVLEIICQAFNVCVLYRYYYIVFKACWTGALAGIGFPGTTVAAILQFNSTPKH